MRQDAWAWVADCIIITFKDGVKGAGQAINFVEETGMICLNSSLHFQSRELQSKMAAAGASWAQVRQQARAAETQVGERQTSWKVVHLY